MKTVGERIRQAREHRHLSGEELAQKVGYKTQSGISNLENRAAGHGGNKITKIAEALNVSVTWLLQGPDTHDMAEVLPFHIYPTDPLPAPIVNDTSSSWPTLRERSHALLEKISDRGLTTAVEMLEALADRHPRNDNGAGVHLPARRREA